MRRLIFAAVVLAITLSNISFEWGNAYLVCLFAVIAGYAVDVTYVIVYHRHAARIRRAVHRRGPGGAPPQRRVFQVRDLEDHRDRLERGKPQAGKQ